MELISSLMIIGWFFGAFIISICFHEIGHFLVLRYYGINGNFAFENGNAMVRTRLYGDEIYKLNTMKSQTILVAGGFLELVWLISILLIFPSLYTAVLFDGMLLYDCVETINAPYNFHKRMSDVCFYLETKEDHRMFYKFLKESDSEYVNLPLMKTCYEINPFLDVEENMILKKMGKPFR